MGGMGGMEGGLKDLIVEMGTKWTEGKSKNGKSGKKERKNRVIYGS